MCSRYNTKPSDGEVPVLVFRTILSMPSLLLFPGHLWPGIVIPVRVPSMNQKEMFYFLNLKPFVGKQMTDVKLNYQYYIASLGTL